MHYNIDITSLDETRYKTWITNYGQNPEVSSITNENLKWVQLHYDVISLVKKTIAKRPVVYKMQSKYLKIWTSLTDKKDQTVFLNNPVRNIDIQCVLYNHSAVPEKFGFEGSNKSFVIEILPEEFASNYEAHNYYNDQFEFATKIADIEEIAKKLKRYRKRKNVSDTERKDDTFLFKYFEQLCRPIFQIIDQVENSNGFTLNELDELSYEIEQAPSYIAKGLLSQEEVNLRVNVFANLVDLDISYNEHNLQKIDQLSLEEITNHRVAKDSLGTFSQVWDRVADLSIYQEISQQISDIISQDA